MGSLSRSEIVGLAALLVITVIITAFTAVRALAPGVQPATRTHAGILVRGAPASGPGPQLPAVSGPALPPAASAGAPPAPGADEIVVHVAGAVRKPGVYTFPPGARGIDALKAAGGPAQDANTDAIDLAARLVDGAQLYFPTKKEQPAGGASSTDVASQVRASGPASGKTARATSRGGRNSNKLTSPSQGQVNINTADAATLQRLPGIGPAMAQRIIAFRQQSNGFQRPEDLMEVSGIGPKKLAKMRPYITVR